MTLIDAVRLGRISNLPTVWTNAIAGIVLANGAVTDQRFLLLLLAVSIAYIAGMYLNDAFDAEFDRAERPHRPIPAGRVRRSTVLRIGFSLLIISTLLLVWIGYGPADGTGYWPGLSGVALAGAITFYDLYHKGNPLSPLVMGLCRALVYVTASFAVAANLSFQVLLGASLLGSYVIGLTYLAKQETLGRISNLWPLLFLAAPIVFGIWQSVIQPLVWIYLVALAGVITLSVGLAIRRRQGDISRATVTLIAGISILDAMLIAGAGHNWLALLAAAGFLATLALQRVVQGT